MKTSQFCCLASLLAFIVSNTESVPFVRFLFSLTGLAFGVAAILYSRK